MRGGPDSSASNSEVPIIKKPAVRWLKPNGRPTSAVCQLVQNTVSQSFTSGRSRRGGPGLSDRLREGPDAQQEFGIVLPTKVGLFLEVLVIGELSSQITGE